MHFSICKQFSIDEPTKSFVSTPQVEHLFGFGPSQEPYKSLESQQQHLFIVEVIAKTKDKAMQLEWAYQAI